MPGNPECTLYIGNLDEKVNDRVLYEILIQAGRVVDLYVPRDKDTNRPKGYAFAEYETEEIADYAVRLFSGLVTLYNRTLKFAISGQDKPSQNLATPRTPASNSHPLPRAQPHMQISGQDKPSQNLANPRTPASNSPPLPRAQPPMQICGQDMPIQNLATPRTPSSNSSPLPRAQPPVQISGRDKPIQNLGTPRTPASNSPPLPTAQPTMQLRNIETFLQTPQLTPCRFSARTQSMSPIYAQAPGPGLVSRGNRSDFHSNGFNYSRRVLRSELDNIRGYGHEAHFR